MIWLEIFGPTGVYLAGAVYTFGRVSSAIAWNNMSPRGYRSRPDWEQGIFVGCLNAPIWPVTLPVWALIWRSRRRGGFAGDNPIMRPPHYLREVANDYTTQAREKYIKELEREAGIR